MSCHFCSGAGIEPFTNAPTYTPGNVQDIDLQVPRFERKEVYSQQDPYTCQQQKVQACMYNAQGEMMCTTDATFSTTFSSGSLVDE